LVLGASITVVNAFDAFFDHKALWISRTVMLARLYRLRRELRFEVAKSAPEEILMEVLSNFHSRLGDILQDDLREWLKLRTDTEHVGDALVKHISEGEDASKLRDTDDE
jgi:hypothetical protein